MLPKTAAFPDLFNVATVSQQGALGKRSGNDQSGTNSVRSPVGVQQKVMPQQEVEHIWNVCKVSGIRAMPSHVNNQKLQPRFQRVSGHRSRVSHLRLCAIDRPLYCRCVCAMGFIHQVYNHMCMCMYTTRARTYLTAHLSRCARCTSGYFEYTVA